MGAGSRFTVLLPRMNAGATDIPLLPSAQAPRGSETILLVEDDPPVRDVVRDTLRSLGYAVLDAGNGDEALRLAASAAERGARIDLVLTDVVMPQTNGRELGQRLAERWPNMKIVYMSGYTDDEILRRGLMQSGITFLEKPFTPHGLAEAVRRALDEPPHSA